MVSKVARVDEIENFRKLGEDLDARELFEE